MGNTFRTPAPNGRCPCCDGLPHPDYYEMRDQYFGNLATVHDKIVGDTRHDDDLHNQALAAFKNFVNELDTKWSDQVTRTQVSIWFASDAKYSSKEKNFTKLFIQRYGTV